MLVILKTLKELVHILLLVYSATGKCQVYVK